MSEFPVSRIKVIGVGGAGCRVVGSLMEAGPESVEYLMISDEDPRIPEPGTDAHTILLGKETRPQPFCRLTPKWGKRFALDGEEAIRGALDGGDPLLLVAGMGGGLGTGAAPIIARIGKEMEAITIAVLSTPFPFEGKDRHRVAQRGVEEISEVADMTIVIPYERALSMIAPRATIREGWKTMDKILGYGVKGLADLIRHGEWGLVDGDHETLKSFLSESGPARMGLGAAERLPDAMEQALSSPLLENRLGRARKVIVSLTPYDGTMLSEIHACTDLLRKRLRQDVETALACLPCVTSRNWAMVTLYATSIDRMLS